MQNRYEVCRSGPGSLTGPKFRNLTDALAYVRHLLRSGVGEVRVIKL